MKIRIKNPIWGVPITFLYKYNPTQFEIIGLMSGAKDSSLINGNDGRAKFYINGKGVYARILIKKVSLNKAFFRALKVKDDRLYLKLL